MDFDIYEFTLLAREQVIGDKKISPIEKYGAIKGTLLGIKRVLKCNPFSKGGYDPLK